MPLYVLALTDTVVEPGTASERHVHTESFGDIHAVCGRRTAVPPATDTELRAQHARVVELSARCRAILPVRFGTLVTKGELARFIREHRDEIAAGLDLVRDRAQMTVRIIGRRPAVPARTRPVSGRAYLEQRRSEASPPLPASARALLSRLGPLAVAERRDTGGGPLIATVYHLVKVTDVSRYVRAARGAPRTILVSGPWPPFAFTPRFS